MKKLIRKLPYPIIQAGRYIYGAVPLRIRYGKVFWETYKFLQESQWWPKEKLERYQMQQLSRLLHHSYENVPYYRRVFDERGLKPEDIKDIDDMKKLPYLTKEIIQENLQDLISQNYPKTRLQYVTTGGSTGIPLGFYLDKDESNAKEWAFIYNQWKRVGFKFRSKRVILRGGEVVPSADKGKFWEYNPIDKTLTLSSYNMTDEVLTRYIEKIRNTRPDFIHCNPSLIMIFAKFMKRNNISPFPSIKALLCCSENIYNWQRDFLKDVFQCRVYSWYGHSEQCALAGECEKSAYYHLFPEYGFVELVGEDGNHVDKEDGVGEIVATGFNNYVMPFIRYRTRDLGVYTNQECSCKRNYPLLKRVEGRMQDIVVTRDKRFILVQALVFGSAQFNLMKIDKMQVLQYREGEIIVRIVKTPKFTGKDELKILLTIKKKVGDGLNVKFDYVDKIPGAKSGKPRFLIQKLPIEFGNTE